MGCVHSSEYYDDKEFGVGVEYYIDNSKKNLPRIGNTRLMKENRHLEDDGLDDRKRSPDHAEQWFVFPVHPDIKTEDIPQEINRLIKKSEIKIIRGDIIIPYDHITSIYNSFVWNGEKIINLCGNNFPERTYESTIPLEFRIFDEFPISYWGSSGTKITYYKLDYTIYLKDIIRNLTFDPDDNCTIKGKFYKYSYSQFFPSVRFFSSYSQSDICNNLYHVIHEIIFSYIEPYQLIYFLHESDDDITNDFIVSLLKQDYSNLNFFTCMSKDDLVNNCVICVKI